MSRSSKCSSLLCGLSWLFLGTLVALAGCSGDHSEDDDVSEPPDEGSPTPTPTPTSTPTPSPTPAAIALEFSFSSFDFGDVVLGTSSGLGLGLKNVGSVAVKVYLSVSPDETIFSVESDHVVRLDPGENTSVSVLFTPDTVDEFSAELVAAVDDDYQIVLALTGAGTSPDGDADGDGWTPNGGDCNDSNVETYPGAAEDICTGVDNNCDGYVAIWPTWYRDVDDDDYGVDTDTTIDCTQPDGYAINGGDCNDKDAAVHPYATEVCDGKDNDCNGLADASDSSAEGTSQYYPDADHDGYGTGEGTQSCEDTPPSGYAAAGGDCDDANAALNPGEPEVCDGFDDNCDGVYTVCADEDADADGYIDADDCDEADPAVHAGALEVCNDGIDQNCDGQSRCLSGTMSIELADAIFDETTVSGTSGAAVALADLDNDGLDDIVVGAPWWNDDTTTGGRAYVFYGPVSGTFDPSQANATITATGVNEGFGLALTADGDLNGDGYRDLAFGAHDACDYAETGKGRVYVFFGPVAGNYAAADADVVLEGATDLSCGGNALSIGDLNGDKKDDLVIGSMEDSSAASEAGAVYVFFGPISSDMPFSGADIRIYGEAYDWSGAAVSARGDVDGDGHADLLLGAPRSFYHGESKAGSAYLFYGPLDGDYRLADADAHVPGPERDDYFGAAVAIDGDVNDDGLADVVASAVGVDTYAGVIYLFHGPLSGEVSLDTAVLTVRGNGNTHGVGFPVTLANDVDGDGHQDLVFGATGAYNTQEEKSGALYVIYGPRQGSITAYDADVKIEGRLEEDVAGCAVSAGGDADGDGIHDLLVGAPGADDDVSSYDGKVYLKLGGMK